VYDIEALAPLAQDCRAKIKKAITDRDLLNRGLLKIDSKTKLENEIISELQAHEHDITEGITTVTTKIGEVGREINHLDHLCNNTNRIIYDS